VQRLLESSILVLCILSCAGCAGIVPRARPDATEYKRTASYAFPQTEKTSLRDALAEDIAKNKGKSGFRIFEKGSQSLMARLALVRLAERSLDLQYYGIGDDTSSHLMMKSLLLAAERGVRVRLLIDSFTVTDMKDSLNVLENVPNIEIRVFNPMVTRDQSLLSRVQGLFSDIDYVNKRMHNKAFIADNQVALVGGRNVSDAYFEADEELDFKDLDVLTAGPITAEISESFDAYWNNKNAFPIQMVHEPEKDPAAKEHLARILDADWEKEFKNPRRQLQLTAPLREVIQNPDMALIWAVADLAVDDPAKVDTPREENESDPLNKMMALLRHAQKEFLIISAYFVPMEDGVRWLSGLEQKGIAVRVLTNSLASTDVVAVHSGYEPYRKDMLKNGIELYELMPMDGKKAEQRLVGRAQPPRAGLHSKVYLIDDEYTVIGSFNLDPRSVELNTEMAVIIQSPEIAARMKRLFERTIAPELSYRLALTKDDQLVWNGIEKGRKLHHKTEPHAGFWRNLQNKISNIIPADQL
jgi:putative cardiolipin synthase